MLRVCFWGLMVSFLLTSCSTPLKLNNQFRASAVPDSLKRVQSRPVAASLPILKPVATREQGDETISGKIALPDIEMADVDLEAIQLPLPTEVQIKYASLLDMLPYMLTNVKLLETIDEWYGIRYRYGGTSKRGVDCSAFVRAVYKSAFDISLPRTARQQFRAASVKVSSNLKQGDLLFFNTTGGISHVGMYLGNNRFVHASSGSGVTVSDLEDNYYATRYLGARRIKDSTRYAAN